VIQLIPSRVDVGAALFVVHMDGRLALEDGAVGAQHMALPSWSRISLSSLCLL